MKRIILTLLSTIAFFPFIELAAQISFEQVPPPPPAPQIIAEFHAVYRSSISFADVDGDNDEDILITGFYGSGRIAKLYTNDGNGNYSQVAGTPFVGVQDGSVAFTDVDGDNDQDMLITGENSSSQPIAKLYENDGNGNYRGVRQDAD